MRGFRFLALPALALLAGLSLGSAAAITITARGRDALAEAMPLWREVQGRMAEGLGSTRWSQLIRNLSAAVDLAQGK